MPKVLAKSVKDHEYLYDPRSARMVSDRSADKICEIANSVRYLLKDKDRVERRVKEAIDAYMEDPWEISSWMDGMEVVVSA